MSTHTIYPPETGFHLVGATGDTTVHTRPTYPGDATPLPFVTYLFADRWMARAFHKDERTAREFHRRQVEGAGPVLTLS